MDHKRLEDIQDKIIELTKRIDDLVVIVSNNTQSIKEHANLIRNHAHHINKLNDKPHFHVTVNNNEDSYSNSSWFGDV